MHRNLLGDCEFGEIRRSERQTLLSGVTAFLSVSSILIFRFLVKFGVADPQLIVLNIVIFIKSQILRWAGHVMRMDTTRTVKKITE